MGIPKKKITEKREYLHNTSFSQNQFCYFVVTGYSTI